MSTSQELKDRFSAGKTPSTEDYGALIDSIPSGGGGTVDSAISSTSQNALQNKVLYNELRITETTTKTVNAVNLGDGSQPREIITLDATDFDSYSFIQGGGSGDTVDLLMLPNSMREDKAYIILNSEYKKFFHENSGTYCVKFCGSTESEGVSVDIAKEDTNTDPPYIDYVGLESLDSGYWYLINFNVYKESSTGSGYVASGNEDSYTWMRNQATTGQTTITETVTKSLKQKISELEQRIAALEN
jgi:hypothetical protein